MLDFHSHLLIFHKPFSIAPLLSSRVLPLTKNTKLKHYQCKSDFFLWWDLWFCLFLFFFSQKRSYWLMFSLRSTTTPIFLHTEPWHNLAFSILNLDRNNKLHRCCILNLPILNFILFSDTFFCYFGKINFSFHCILQQYAVPPAFSQLHPDFCHYWWGFSHAYHCFSWSNYGNRFFPFA